MSRDRVQLRMELCSAVSEGDSEKWHLVLDKFQRSDGEGRALLRHALGCTQHVWLLNK